jgi:hypothetical protein
MARTITTTPKKLAAAFAEWDRRYREDRKQFMSDVQHLLENTPITYGELASAHLILILKQQKKKGKA